MKILYIREKSFIHGWLLVWQFSADSPDWFGWLAATFYWLGESTVMFSSVWMSKHFWTTFILCIKCLLSMSGRVEVLRISCAFSSTDDKYEYAGRGCILYGWLYDCIIFIFTCEIVRCVWWQWATEQKYISERLEWWCYYTCNHAAKSKNTNKNCEYFDSRRESIIFPAQWYELLRVSTPNWLVCKLE